MKIKISELKENPFRKELGPYNEEQIKRIIESFKMSDFGKDQRFEVRKKDNSYELVYGHHRLEALKYFYKKDIEVEVLVRDYNDEKMLVELLRENLIRNYDWYLKMLALALVKKYLKLSSKEVGLKDILHFISKENKIMREEEAEDLLRIHENLAPELLEKTRKMESIYSKYKNSDYINLSQARILSYFKDKQEQLDLAKALKNSLVQDVREQSRLLSKYKEADKELKEKIRSGEIDLIVLKNITKERVEEDRNARSREYEETERIKSDLSANKQALYIYGCLSDAIKNIERLNKKRLDLKTKLSLERIYKKTIAVLTEEISNKEVINV